MLINGYKTLRVAMDDSEFEENIIVKYSTIQTAAEKALDVIRGEIPEEAQTAECFSIVIEEMKKKLERARLMPEGRKIRRREF